MSKAAGPRRHMPLADDISQQDGRLRTKSITGKRKSRSDDDGHGDGYIDARSSRKILAIAQDLVDEDAHDSLATTQAVEPNAAFAFDSRLADESEDDGEVQHGIAEEDEWLPEEEVDAEDLDPADMAVYNKFLPEGAELVGFEPSLAKLTTSNLAATEATEEAEPPDQGQTRNLADLILQRIAEKEAFDAARTSNHPPIFTNPAPADNPELPEKVVETFTKVAHLLSRYKSGPLPKPFKVLPSLPQWPELLQLTQPDTWTPNAIYAATKIFISSTPATAQHFCSTVLLDAVKQDIHETRKLNVHLYNSLKKALYKPAAFFKGFLFPLVADGCTLREAHIISSVLAKISIPVLHSAAALLRLCEIAAVQSSVNSEHAGAANIFIRTLLEKKYALPYKAIDALVFHFLRFRPTTNGDEEEHLAAKESKLPVLWHQSLLIFAQRYKNDITEDQREALLDLLLGRGHREIGPEIRRELLAGRGRGMSAVEPVDVNGAGLGDGDDTMDLRA